jgi:hypothetical protein
MNAMLYYYFSLNLSLAAVADPDAEPRSIGALRTAQTGD